MDVLDERYFQYFTEEENEEWMKEMVKEKVLQGDIHFLIDVLE